MDCVNELLTQLDLAAENFEFPLWECGEENAFVGKMRASGFTSNKGKAIVFEVFEYSIKEGFIQSIAYCIANFSISNWVSVGESIQLNMRSSQTEKLPFGFGRIEVKSRERKFSILLEREELIAKDYLTPDAYELTVQAVILQICDVVHSDWLFSIPDYLIRTFSMCEDSRRLFVIENWQHPSFDELYSDENKPSDSPDIRAMVQALCSENSLPRLVNMANTSWQMQCKARRLG